MSATLEAEKFKSYFFGAPLMKVPGRLHPVKIRYTDMPQKEYLEAAISRMMEIHMKEPAGDILVFLTGEEEIEVACRKISKKSWKFRGQGGPCESGTIVFYSSPSYAAEDF